MILLLAAYFRIVTIRLIFSEHRDVLSASLISVSLQVSYAKVAEVARRLGGTSQRTGRVWAEVQCRVYLKRGERSRRNGVATPSRYDTRMETP